ncbi:hypothetical protein LSG31_15945 [Fodinisporobacter ferrooxydans]|uniref:DUF2802 domain-containing protein n=1 Tax=Fodinisporobacter ferrooxydans TaxID=2901836 RepID=A0ABY4CFT0_9BACL|nr:hypothetical protein LSG31_15945 [Alicyclobacillaceae bacterium MYW30-H2]
MAHIILYLALVGVAIFLYALARPGQKQSGGAAELQMQQRFEHVIQKMSAEQSAIAETLHGKIMAMQTAIDSLSEIVKQQEERIKHLSHTERNFESEQTAGANVTEGLAYSPRHLQVVTLLKNGKDVQTIARETGVGIGEIQLLQRLMRQNQGDAR